MGRVGQGEWERESGEWECRRRTLRCSRQRSVHLPGHTHLHLPVYIPFHGQAVLQTCVSAVWRVRECGHLSRSRLLFPPCVSPSAMEPVHIVSLNCSDGNVVHAAAEAFWDDGAVILEDAISEHDCDAFYDGVLERFTNEDLPTFLRSGGAEGSRCNWVADAALQRLYLPILQHGVLRNLLVKLVGWHRWIKLTGDVVFPHCQADQALHSDWPSCMPLHSPPESEEKSCKHTWVPPCIVVSLVVETQRLAKAPLRLLNWKAMRALGGRRPPESLCPAARDAVCVGVPKGALIIRDIRVWHGGTRMQEGCAALPRVLPGLQCVSDAYIKELWANRGRTYDGPQKPPRHCGVSLFEALPEEYQAHCHYLVPHER